jgi:hypothetical protein
MSIVSWHVRRVLVAAGKATVSAAALWLIARQLDLEAIEAVGQRLQPEWIAAVIAVIVSQFLLVVWRWQLILLFLRSSAPSFGFLSWSLGASYVYGQILPSALGGDIIRASLLAPSFGAGAAARSVICDRAFALATLGIMILAAGPGFLVDIDSGWAFQVVLLAALLSTVLFIAVVLIGPRLRSRFHTVNKILVVLRDQSGVLRSPFGLAVVGSSFGIHLLSILLAYTIARMIGTDLRLLNCLLLIPPIMLINTLPISLGGWGVREQAFLLGFQLVGVPTVDSVLTSILFGLTTPLSGLVALLVGQWSGDARSDRK